MLLPCLGNQCPTSAWPLAMSRALPSAWSTMSVRGSRPNCRHSRAHSSTALAYTAAK